MNRIRAGFCMVANPRNPGQTTRISLEPEDVEAIVFWTRNPDPFLHHLGELHRRGFRTFFLFTLVDYPPLLEPRAASLDRRMDAFRRLSERIGPERLTWRYDPVILSSMTGVPYHISAFQTIARTVEGASHRCIVSLLDVYGGVRRRMAELEPEGFRLLSPQQVERLTPELASAFLRIADSHGFTVQSCAEERTLPGIPKGACIDGELLEKTFGIAFPRRKDPSQRRLCRCVSSRDIGAYDTCPGGCRYCYATGRSGALETLRRPSPDCPFLLPPDRLP